MQKHGLPPYLLVTESKIRQSIVYYSCDDKPACPAEKSEANRGKIYLENTAYETGYLETDHRHNAPLF